MSNGEDKRCPLCAEEMDWTDQQFMPCQCGYQVCVWCWHHIIDMAEKDQTDGRCPACRTIYEKEKIVAMQANCGRTMSKVPSKKAKPPKAKPKANEVTKDLTNVRVIQRKMVYVIGLPLSLADENVLQRKEYFGLYGKVTKVALSRTTGGTIQQFTNDTCSVYITYSKEEEALRCIQSVHGFILEDRLLRASFGTAKYCHAWLKNMQCNNSACLYLHTIGADEDSFGKEEVAAVHTRNRVQQIVGASNNVVKRCGNMLPPPFNDIYNSSTTFTDIPTVRSGISDAIHGSANSTEDTAFPLTPKENEGANAVAQKVTTFVDIVGRSNSAAPEKDTYTSEDRGISDLCSELSSVTTNGDTQPGEPYSFPPKFKMCSYNHIGNGLFENIPDDPSIFSDDQGSSDNYSRTFSCHPSDPAIISEDSSGSALLHKNNHSMNDFALDHDPVQIRYAASVLTDSYHEMKFQNSMKSGRISNDSCQEMKFQNSAKSDRIYRSSNSFSNEEIVEHLRRIDDGDTNNDKDIDAVESSIISNIMSIGLDSCEDSLTVTRGLSEFLDETDGLGGSSWSSLNSDQSGCSFVKQEGFANQMAGPIFPDYGDNKEQFSCKPHYQVNRSQNMAPPGFSLPVNRDPPPGFSASGRMGCLSRASSGTSLANACPFPSTFLQPSSTRLNSSSINDADFFDPSTLLNCNGGKQTNGFNSPSFETRSGNPQQNAFEDESRLWLFMQQQSAHQDSRFSQMFPPQSPSAPQEPSYNVGNGISAHQEQSYKAHMRNGLSAQHESSYKAHMGNGLSAQQVLNYKTHMGNGISAHQEQSYKAHMGNGLTAQQESSYKAYIGNGLSAQHELSYNAHMGNGLSAQQELNYKAHMGNGLSAQQEPSYKAHMGNGLSAQQESSYKAHTGNGISAQQEPSYKAHMGNGLSAQQESSYKAHTVNGISAQQEPSYKAHMGNGLSAQHEPSYKTHMRNGLSTQQEPSYKSHLGNGLSGLDDMYGLSSRLINEQKNYNQSFFRQTYPNGHVSNTNGYRHSFDEVTELQRHNRLGTNYFPGYGDSMLNSTRVFGS